MHPHKCVSAFTEVPGSTNCLASRTAQPLIEMSRFGPVSVLLHVWRNKKSPDSIPSARLLLRVTVAMQIFCLQVSLLFLLLLVLLILVAWKTYGGLLRDFYEAYGAPLEFHASQKRHQRS